MMIYEGVFNFVEGNKSRAGYDPHDVLVCCRFYLMMLYFSIFSIGAANVRDWSSLIIVMDGQKGVFHSAPTTFRNVKDAFGGSLASRTSEKNGRGTVHEPRDGDSRPSNDGKVNKTINRPQRSHSHNKQIL